MILSSPRRSTADPWITPAYNSTGQSRSRTNRATATPCVQCAWFRRPGRDDGRVRSGRLLHGYGFLAVFISALSLRSRHRAEKYHAVLHQFTAETEQVASSVLLVLVRRRRRVWLVALPRLARGLRRRGSGVRHLTCRRENLADRNPDYSVRAASHRVLRYSRSRIDLPPRLRRDPRPIRARRRPVGRRLVHDSLVDHRARSHGDRHDAPTRPSPASTTSECRHPGPRRQHHRDEC